MSSPAGQFISQLTFPKSFLMSIFLGFLYFKFLGYDDGSRIESEIQQIQTSVTNEQMKKKETDKVLAEEIEIKKQVGALSEKFKEVTLKFPVNLKSDEIIATLNSLAKASTVRVVSVKKENVNVQELYEEVPLSVEMSGTFNNIVELMYKTATLERVTNLGDFDITNIESDYNGILKMTTKVIGYKYRKPPEKTDEKSQGKAVPKPGGVK